MKEKITTKVLRDFGILIGFGFPIILGIIIPLLYGHSFRAWTLFIGIPFLMLGFIYPRILFYPFKFWMKLGYVLGWVNSRIILGLVFLLVLQPVALFMKFFNYDPLKKKKSLKPTYREKVENKKINLKKVF